MNSPGERLRALREARGWSQRELAQHLQCSQAQVSLVEHGTRPPHMAMAAAIEAWSADEPTPIRMNEWLPVSDDHAKTTPLVGTFPGPEEAAAIKAAS